jgi:quercetin dioxygenase-like cupin family protein
MSRRNDLPEFAQEAGERGDKHLLDALSELGPPPKAPPQLLRERLLATIARPRLRFAPLFGALSELFDLADADLASIFERAARPEEWVAAPIPGTRLLHVVGGPRVAHADNGLVKLRAGARFPRHRHLGSERVLVLEGAYRDEASGRVYQAGDLHEMAEGTEHAYSALGERDLLFAVSLVCGVDVEGYGALTPATAG